MTATSAATSIRPSSPMLRTPARSVKHSPMPASKSGTANARAAEKRVSSDQCSRNNDALSQKRSDLGVESPAERRERCIRLRLDVRVRAIGRLQPIDHFEYGVAEAGLGS